MVSKAYQNRSVEPQRCFLLHEESVEDKLHRIESYQLFSRYKNNSRNNVGCKMLPNSLSPPLMNVHSVHDHNQRLLWDLTLRPPGKTSNVVQAQIAHVELWIEKFCRKIKYGN